MSGGIIIVVSVVGPGDCRLRKRLIGVSFVDIATWTLYRNFTLLRNCASLLLLCHVMTESRYDYCIVLIHSPFCFCVVLRNLQQRYTQSDEDCMEEVRREL